MFGDGVLYFAESNIIFNNYFCYVIAINKSNYIPHQLNK